MTEAIPESSLIGKLEVDVEIKSPAKKFYNLFVNRTQDVTKATPENVQVCDLHEEESVKVGGILSWNYVLDGQPKVMTERIDTLDPEKNLISSTILGGDLMREFKSFLFTLQLTPKENGPGTIVKCTADYEKIDEKVAPPENLLSMYAKVFKDIDELLLSQV